MGGICRICLKAIKDTNFQVIDGLIKEILEVLLLKLNVTVSEEARICQFCVKELEKCFEFKSSCLYTEDRIYPLVDSVGSTELDLREIYINENKNANFSGILKNQRVCRFCMKLVKDGCYRSLKEVEQNVFLHNMLQKYFPEIDFSVIRDPVLCNACYDTLSDYFTFALNCLHTEDNIQKYCDVEGTNSRGYVDLCGVAEFILTTQQEHVASKNKVIKLERHSFSEDERESHIMMEVENFTGHIKNEEIEIKSELNNDQSFEDTMSPPHPRKNEEIRDVKKRNRSKCAQKCIIEVPSRERALYKCELCPYSTNYRSRFDNHLRNHEKLKKPSDEIKIPSTSLKGFLETPMYKCDNCSYKTKFNSVLRQHNRFVHNEGVGVKVHRCENCDYTTKYMTSMKRHVRIHMSKSEVTIYECDHCEYGSKYAANIRKHIRRKHATM